MQWEINYINQLNLVPLRPPKKTKPTQPKQLFPVFKVEELLRLMTELWEEMSRLSNIRESKRQKPLESHPAFPETDPTARQDTWHEGFSNLSPHGWTQWLKGQWETVKSSCPVQEVFLLCDFPGAFTPQEQVSASGTKQWWEQRFN